MEDSNMNQYKFDLEVRNESKRKYVIQLAGQQEQQNQNPMRISGSHRKHAHTNDLPKKGFTIEQIVHNFMKL